MRSGPMTMNKKRCIKNIKLLKIPNRVDNQMTQTTEKHLVLVIRDFFFERVGFQYAKSNQ